MEGRHIDVTTLQRIDHFFKELLDVFSVLQGFLRGAGFGWFLAQGGVYINLGAALCRRPSFRNGESNWRMYLEATRVNNASS